MSRTPRWNAADVPDQTGRTFVVTGANAGIGRATTATLTARGAKVIMACRNLDKAEAARDSLPPESRELAEIRRLDLADLDSVEDFLAASAPAAPAPVRAEVPVAPPSAPVAIIAPVAAANEAPPRFTPSQPVRDIAPQLIEPTSFAAKLAACLPAAPANEPAPAIAPHAEPVTPPRPRTAVRARATRSWCRCAANWRRCAK